MKFNVNRETLDFLSRYRSASKAHGEGQVSRYLRFGGNLLCKPQRSFYYPEFLKVEITTACNISCSFCGAAQVLVESLNRPGKYMPVETLQKIIEHVPMLRWIDLQGVGEPLVHPCFREILQILTRRNISACFTTNGILLNKRMRKAVLKSLVHSITISLSAASSESYWRLHGINAFEQVLANVRVLVAARQNNFPKIRLLAVPMRQNLAELPKLANIAMDLRVDSLVLSAYKPICENDIHAPRLSSLRFAVASVKERAFLLGVPLELEVPIALSQNNDEEHSLSWQKCLFPWSSIVVNVDGDVLPCCYIMGNKQFNLGNLLQTNIYEIFNNRNYRLFRKELNQGKTQSLPCHNCNDSVG